MNDLQARLCEGVYGELGYLSILVRIADKNLRHGISKKEGRHSPDLHETANSVVRAKLIRLTASRATIVKKRSFKSGYARALGNKPSRAAAKGGRD
jgi:hypothetical protein